MLHVYTFGKKSKQFLILTPNQAHLVNMFTRAFFEAQGDFMKKNGRRWTPSETIEFNLNSLSRKELDKYNKLVTRVLNPQHKIRNRAFDLLRINVAHEDLDDFLVKRI